MEKECFAHEAIHTLCEEFKKNNRITPELYQRYDVKRGLRNPDGSGVVAGLTQISNVHGYVLNEGEREPVPGTLFYRGYNINDLVSACDREQRFGFEEVIYLLLFGILPTAEQLSFFRELIGRFMHLPKDFFEDMILKAPSRNIMNKMERGMLALYSYDPGAEDYSLEAELGRALQLVARVPNIMVKAYQVKNRTFDHQSMFLHPIDESLSIAEEILSLLRMDRKYTREEALLLDLCLMLHAEHGGGNNSTFVCRTITSAGTDCYSAYAGAIGALKGHRHGGANIKVLEMVENIRANVADITDRNAVKDYLHKIINRQANDGSGLVYGMGHAVYTLSDPRAVLLKDRAARMAKGTEYEDDFILLNIIEEETPGIFHEEKDSARAICANVDLYSGMVYRMLGVPVDLFTPLFACARMAGWSAHRIEELYTGNRIIRPAYKSVSKPQKYLPLQERA